MVELVSNKSPEEIAKIRAQKQIERSRQRVESALIEMTANLLRVTRGAGRPGALVMLAGEFVEACVEYRSLAGTYPPSEILAQMLEWQRDFEYIQKFDDFNQTHIVADEMMARGALQIVASRLLGQNTQESAGHHELYKGMRDWEEIRDRRNREMFEATTKQRRAKPRRGRKIE